jgi:hypothetical protein
MDVTLPRWKRSDTSLRMVRLASYPNVTCSISIRVSALAIWGSLGMALVLFLSASATGVRAQWRRGRADCRMASPALQGKPGYVS